MNNNARRTFWLSLLVATCFPLDDSQPAVAVEVPVVVSATAGKAVRLAADELAEYLGQVHRPTQFPVVRDLPPSGPAIRVGEVDSDPLFKGLANGDRLATPESYLVTTTDENGRKIGIIAGADPRGVMYAVYGLLEKLGCGFYLSYDAVPAAAKPFSFDAWQLADSPLYKDRIVFDWHNFLSGCSTWNLEDWQAWVRGAQRSGYNGVMVHAYGNNPMVSFTFGGQTKPVGYLSTTVKGRDWSTQHVNDVRRLYGGEAFDSPVFGPTAALVPDDRRADAARKLMNGAFAFAEDRAMNVYLAVDVDTVSANPQPLIETLPPEGRFPIAVKEMRWMNQAAGELWLANPDTPAGYRYYKAQVDAILAAYPQLDCLVVWFRHNETPWMAFKESEMPQPWQNEYRAELKKTPDAADLWRSHNFFALGKIVSAFDRALAEAGRTDIRMAVGSWRFDFFPPADRFLPEDVTLIPLDYEVLHDKSQMDTAELRRVIAAAGENRPVIPVVWAHHDDGNYLGRPYTPYADFHDKLTDSKAAGFGIIHWTTRPLDLYFTSLSEQTWQATKNRPLAATCQDVAQRAFGPENRQVMGEYLLRWITEAPKIGRETGDQFIDRDLGEVGPVAEASEKRKRLLATAVNNTDDPVALDRIYYFRGLEDYVVGVYSTEADFNRAKAALKSGNLDVARRAMAACRPGEVIQRYAQSCRNAQITRGEQGLVVSMNLRWLTHYVRYRQALGMEAVRYNFAPTSHDPLAQSMGTFTFHFDRDRTVWECLGTRATGAETFTVPGHVEISASGDEFNSQIEKCRSGIQSEKPITIILQPIMSDGGRGRLAPLKLPAGSYRLHVLMLDPTSTGPGQRVFELSIRSGEDTQEKQLDIFKLTGRRNWAMRMTQPVEVGASGQVDLTLTPIKGKALICGAILEPEF